MMMMIYHAKLLTEPLDTLKFLSYVYISLLLDEIERSQRVKYYCSYQYLMWDIKRARRFGHDMQMY